MTDPDELLETIEYSREDLVEFLLEFANKSNVHGHEKEASDFLWEWLDDQPGIAAKQYEVLPDRPNVIGTVPGVNPEAGNDLLFNSHLDLGPGLEQKDRWRRPEQHRIYRESWREGDILVGDDISHAKPNIAAFVWAAKALTESDIELNGDLILTAVIGEIEAANVDEYDGPQYLGAGVGAQQLLDAGFTADYAFNAENTEYSIVQMQCGVVWFKITVNGQTGYMPPLEYDDDAVGLDHPGAISQAAVAVNTLETWARDYTKRSTQEYAHGTNRPNAGVLAIRSGEPYSLGVMPGVAAIYMDVRLPPEEGPEFVSGGIKRVLSEAGIDVKVEPYLFHRGHIADQEHVGPLVSAITNAQETVTGSSPQQPTIGRNSVWRDMNVFNGAGIPSVSYGPSRAHEEYTERGTRAIHIDDILNATKIHALTAMEICGT